MSKVDTKWDKAPRVVGNCHDDTLRVVWPKGHPICSTTKKALKAYNAPSPNFRFRFYKYADPEKVNEALITLQKLGVDASQIEIDS